jgi:membrane-bound metal-dependent hydrolase YbcI (DUF457 family)
MANFNTHLAVAIVASTGTALLAVNAQIITIAEAPEMVAFGAIGGMLPDIDSGNSTPIKLFFTTLAVIALLTVVELFKNLYPAYIVLLMAVATYVGVRYAVLELFDRFTDHRGIFHSVLTAVFFCLLMVCIGCYLLRWNILYCWLSGLFIGFGFIVHLLLDEVYSVDLGNRRMKKSFGTALKLYSYNNLMTSGIMATVTLGLALITPQPQPLIKLWQKHHTQGVFAAVIKKTSQR